MIIELTNIYHCFPETEWELNIAQFSVTPGKILGIVGPNGSGKSTLLRIGAGILSPLKGEIRLDKQDMKKLKRPAIARKLGYLPQELSSEYDVSVEDLVRMGRYPHIRGFGVLGPADLEVVENSLQLTEMAPLRTRRLSRLSGGEKKRAFLASVLTQRPQVLLLDEPTSALDIHHQVQFFRFLKKLTEEGIGIAIVTHDINFASLFSDNLMFLEGGKCLMQGSPGTVLAATAVQDIYGGDVIMGRHPEIDRPYILPRLSQGKKE